MSVIGVAEMRRKSRPRRAGSSNVRRQSRKLISKSERNAGLEIGVIEILSQQSFSAIGIARNNSAVDILL